MHVGKKNLRLLVRYDATRGQRLPINLGSINKNQMNAEERRESETNRELDGYEIISRIECASGAESKINSSNLKKIRSS